MVKLTPQQQKQYVQAEPNVFAPVKGGWGRRGCTNVDLPSATRAVLAALVAAWRNAAPKRLAEEHEGEGEACIIRRLPSAARRVLQ